VRSHLLAWATAPTLPFLAAALRAHPRTAADWRERLGLDGPPVLPGALWLHAASLGELAAVEALLPHLSPPLLVTAESEAAVRAARTLGVPAAALPADHPWCLAPLFAEARPRALVLVESAFWPVLAAEARRRGVPVLRVSARESARTAAARGLAPSLFRADRIWARDEAMARRLAGRAPVVEVGGDLKADRPTGPPRLRWPGPFAVGASLRGPDDERRFLEVVAQHGLRALLAPRHPAPRALPPGWVARTALLDDRVPADASVVLLDTTGELARELRGAEWAFVGGTFDPALGGHSPWDAARAGVPVVGGPHVHAQGDAFARVGASLASTLAQAVAARRPPTPPPPQAARVAAAVEAASGRPGRETAPRPSLWPLVPLVRGVEWARRLRPAWRAPVVVIAVASANARSPGRTSIVRALVRALQPLRVGVATRGYRRARSGRDVRGSWDTADAADLGDEGALLAEAGAEVAAGPDRVAAVQALAARGVAVVLLDDGPGAPLVRDLVLEVVDARFPGARGALPAGEGRAPLSGVDLVLVTHGGRFEAPGHVVSRRMGSWIGGRPEGPVALWTGVGRGADVLASVQESGVRVAKVWLAADHALADERALQAFAGDLPLVCTAKDAVRLPRSLQVAARWLELDVVLPDEVVARVRAAIAAGPRHIARFA
jgi:3-deoxy-D-manno-octulosonic-acid transferase